MSEEKPRSRKRILLGHSLYLIFCYFSGFLINFAVSLAPAKDQIDWVWVTPWTPYLSVLFGVMLLLQDKYEIKKKFDSGIMNLWHRYRPEKKDWEY